MEMAEKKTSKKKETALVGPKKETVVEYVEVPSEDTIELTVRASPRKVIWTACWAAIVYSIFRVPRSG